MKPTTLRERYGLTEDAMFEDDENTLVADGMTDEELKIEALKIATNIGKLMSNVTTEDIVNIAETVAKFIKGGSLASLETTTNDDETSDEEVEDFNTEDGDEETSDEGNNTEDAGAPNESEETEESFEI